jgi:flagellar biosynthesis GTPase FlhF
MKNKQAELSNPSQLNVERIEILKEHGGKQGTFVKAFFVDSALNANLWQVTNDSIPAGLQSGLDKERFHGKTAPLILLEPGNIYGNDFGHPPEKLLMTEAQEPFRVGNAIEFGTDKNTGRAFGVFHIDPNDFKNPKDKARAELAIEMLNNRELAFVSPSLKATEEMHAGDGRILVTKWLLNHLALVKEPAYGEHKAQIRGVCNGDGKECLKQLSNVQAKKYQAHEHGANCKQNEKGVWICADVPGAPGGNGEDFIAECQVTGNIVGQVNGQRFEFEKSGTKEPLKTKPQSKKLMAENENPSEKEQKDKEEQQAKKAQEEKEILEKKEEQAKKANEDVVKKLEEQDKEIQALKQARQAEVIKPMAERVANAKIKIGSIDSKSLQAEIDELVKLPEGALSKLDVEYQAMMDKVANTTSTQQEPRYTYQASNDESGKPGEELLKSIRSRMQ